MAKDIDINIVLKFTISLEINEYTFVVLIGFIFVRTF